MIYRKGLMKHAILFLKTKENIIQTKKKKKNKI